EALRPARRLGGLVSSAQVRCGTSQKPARPLLCLRRPSLSIWGGESPPVGQRLGWGLALCERPLDSHLGRRVGPALALARQRAPRLGDRQWDSEPPAVARAR